MHDAIKYSSLLFGESSTMAEEAALLGVPSIYLNNGKIFYTDHLEKDFNLVYNFSCSQGDQLLAIKKGIEILRNNNSKTIWKKKSATLLSKKIDVTAFMVWFIENYPESFKIMKENSDYQYRFK